MTILNRSQLLVASLGVALGLGSCHRDPGPVFKAPEPVVASSAATPTYVFGQATPPFTTPPVLAGTADVAALVDKVKGSLVNITTSSRATVSNLEIDPFEFFFRGPLGPGTPRLAPREGQQHPQRRSLGSGFVVDKTGYVATNNHVIEGADDITVKLVDGRVYSAKAVGRDPKLDVALLKVEAAEELPALAFGDSDALRVGEYVVAAGNPFGLGQTVTMGIVSAKDRTIGAGPYDDFIQTDASINPGNSGGPLFNLRGEVVGMNTAIHAQGQGIGFAIPSALVKDALAQLRATGHVSRGKLGLVFQPVTTEIARALGQSQAQGALVNDVEPGGPADKAGLKAGDVITKIDNEPVKEGVQLPRIVARHPPGSNVTVTFQRQGREQTVSVTLAALQSTREESNPRSPGNAQPTPNSFGLSLKPVPEGVEVVGVSGNVQNLLRGDVIQQIDGQKVTAPQQVTSALAAAAKTKRPALVKIKRQGRSLYTTVDVSR